MIKNILTTSLASVLLTVSVGTQAETISSMKAVEKNWQASNKSIINDYAISGYQQLHKSSQKLFIQTETFCKNGNEKEWEATARAFHKTMDDWQAIQLLRLGPSDLFMRHFRLEMWPDRSNAAAKQLRKLLLEKDNKILDKEQFSRASTAVQGLSAYERIAFAKEIGAKSFSGDDKAVYRCQLLVAISKNIEQISTDLLREWQGDRTKVMTTPSDKNEAFATHKDVAALFLNELSTQLQVLVGKKLLRPLEEKRFRLKRAESWRSGRSIRNIVLNLESAQKLYALGFKQAVKDTALKSKIDKQFNQTIEVGKSLSMPLQTAYDTKKPTLLDWQKQIGLLQKTITVELPKAVDITLGFNSLDGD